MLWTCSSSTDSQYTTTGAVALELWGSTSVSTSEYGRLDALITRASRWAETYLGYPLGVQIYNETIPAYGSRNLMVSRTPVRGVARLFDSTSTDTATSYASSEIRIGDADAGLINFVSGSSPDWTASQGYEISDYVAPNTESRPWYITYEAGYRLVGLASTAGGTTSTGRTLPEDIETGVIEKTIELYERTGGVISKKIGDLAITYRTCSASAAQESLDPYRRVF